MGDHGIKLDLQGKIIQPSQCTWGFKDDCKSSLAVDPR